MSGLELLNDVFEFDSAYVMNSKTLSVRLTSVTVRMIDAVSWINPLKEEKPLLDWQQFLSAYDQADQALAKHAWLMDWKKRYGERSLDLQLMGSKASQSGEEYTTHVAPLWKHAGFSGMPTYCVMARHGYHSWIEIYFSDQDERALIYHTGMFDRDPSSELDELDVSWDPKAKAGDPHANYAVIDKDGHCHVETFVASAEKRVTAKR
jgi:hypothetical protein